MLRILFLSANPAGIPQLKLEEEFNQIYDKLRSVPRDEFELVQRHTIHIKDLQKVLLEQEPQIVHFSGHGSEKSTLIFQNEDGQSEEVQSRVLTDLFKVHGSNISL